MPNSDPQKTLKNISASATFAKSETHKKLLAYLVVCYEKQVMPTEYDIAVNVYDRNQEFKPADDTIVRVSIYKLRKKLEDYYEKDGKRDSVVLTIPKGRYNVEFTQRSTTWPHKSILRIMFYVSVFALAVSLMYGVQQRSRVVAMQNHIAGYNFLAEDAPVWSSFFASELPFVLVVGDFYIFETSEKLTN